MSKVIYEEIKVEDIKVGDRIKFDRNEGNREIFTITAVSEHFAVGIQKHKDDEYHTLIARQPIDFDFARNSTYIPKGSYYRGASTYIFGAFGEEDDQQELDGERFEGRIKEDGITPHDLISVRNRVKIRKVFRRLQ